MKLQRFELELGAIFGAQHKAIIAAALVHVFLEARFLVLEKRRVSHWALAIRPALHIHLEQSEIDTQLNFFLTVAARKTAHDNLARLIIPILEEVRDVEVHRR